MRETVSSAIRRHDARGMSRRQLVMTYGRDAVIRVLGSDDSEPAVQPTGPLPFHIRLSLARAGRKQGRPEVSRLLGCNEDGLVSYEAGEMIPRRPELVAAIALYLAEDPAALAAELAVLRAAKDKHVAAVRAQRFVRTAG
jgi:hypothetical protein